MLLPDAPDASPADAFRVTSFAAATRLGPLMLRLSAPVRHAADAAIALNGCDVLLRQLQDWTGVAADWHWIESKSWQLGAGTHAAARWRTDAVAHAQIELPWSLLRTLPEPPAAMAEQLDWPALPAVLCAARLRLTADELGQLERGGAVLLPESFAPQWHGRLRAADEPARAGVPVDLASPTAPRLSRRAGDAAPGDDDTDLRIACEVRLGAIRALPADRLGGWCDGQALDGVGAQAQLWRSAGSIAPAQRLACGHLMPWGDGWALALESVDDADLDATVPFLSRA